VGEDEPPFDSFPPVPAGSMARHAAHTPSDDAVAKIEAVTRLWVHQ